MLRTREEIKRKRDLRPWVVSDIESGDLDEDSENIYHVLLRLLQ